MILNIKINRAAFWDQVIRAANQSPGYLATLLWILKDLFKAFPWSVAKLATLSMIGATLPGATIAATIQYIKFLEKGKSINIGIREYHATDPQIIITATIILLLLLLFSSLFLYMSKTVAAGIIREYQKFVTQRIITSFGGVVPDGDNASVSKNENEVINFISKTVIADAQISTRLIRFLNSAFSGLIYLFYSLPIIIYVDPFVTFSLGFLVILFSPFYYKINIMAYKSNIMARRSASGARRTIIHLMDQVKNFRYISQKQIEEIGKKFDEGDLSERINSLPTYLRSIASTELISNIVFTLSIGLVILTQVPSALAGEKSWSSIITYLIFLRISVFAMKKLLAFLTKFSRLYPFINRHKAFIESASKKPDVQIELILKKNSFLTTEATMDTAVKTPNLINVISKISPSRYTVSNILKCHFKTDQGMFFSSDQIYFLSDQGLPQCDGSSNEMLHLPVDDFSEITSTRLIERVKELTKNDFNRYLSQSEWYQLSFDHRVELGVTAALINPASIIMLSGELLINLPGDKSKTIVNQLLNQKKMIMICYSERILKSSVENSIFFQGLCSVIGTDGTPIAMGSPEWIEQHRIKINMMLEKEQSSKKLDTSLEEFDDLDYE